MNIKKEVLRFVRQQIGQLLSDQRRNSGISIEKAAIAAGLTARELMDLENGTNNYSIDDLLKYAHGIDCYISISLAPRDGNHLNQSDMLSKL